MADGTVTIDTRIDSTGAVSGLKGLGSALKKVGSALGLAFSVKMIADFAKETKQMYVDSMTAETKLTTIMRQRMNATDEQINKVFELASAEQKIGVIEDDVAKAGLQQVATFLTNAESIEILLPAMNNLLAQQKGFNAEMGDAVNIGNLMGKVLQGQTSALKRVGITFSEAEENVLKYGTELERANMLARVITNNVGEMNKALGQTDEGKQIQLANAMGDVKEVFGQAFSNIQAIFVPALTQLGAMLDSISAKFLLLSNAIRSAFGKAQITTANNTAKAYNGVADAVGSVGESASNTLASFDDLNVVSNQGVGGGAGVEAGVNTAELVADTIKTNDALDMVSTKLQYILSSLAEFGANLRGAFSNLASGITSTFSAIWNVVKEPLERIWKNALLPIFESVGNLILTIIDSIGNAFGGLADTINEHSESLTDIFNVVAGAIELISIIVKEAIDFIAGMFDPLLATVINVIDAILDAIAGIVGFIRGVFTSDWKMAWNGLLDFLKGICNSILSFFEGIINTIVGGLNNISITIPDWVPEIGGQTFGVNIPKAHFPRLATGAVIPPNKEFMAILGDQTSGTNIEAPLDTIKQAVAEVLGDNSYMQAQMIDLLRQIANKDIIVDTNNMFKTIQGKARAYTKTTGMGAFV